MIRRTVSAALLLLACAALLLPAYAHPGQTDANGGHRDSSTGEYHYHHGYPAHQHTDLNGDGKPDCPYDFDDKTGESSGSPSSKKTVTPKATNPAPTVPLGTKTFSPASAIKSKSTAVVVTDADIKAILGIVLLAVGLFLPIFLLIRQLTKEPPKPPKPPARTSNIQSLLDNPIVPTPVIAPEPCLPIVDKTDGNAKTEDIQQEELIRDFRRTVERLTSELDEAKAKADKLNHELEYVGHFLEYIDTNLSQSVPNYKELAALKPRNAYIDEVGNPHQYENGQDRFQVYAGGGCYHRSHCPTPAPKIPINVIELEREDLASLSQCTVCRPVLPDVQWYKNYKLICAFMVRYQLPEPKE